MISSEWVSVKDKEPDFIVNGVTARVQKDANKKVSSFRFTERSTHWEEIPIS